MWRERRTWRKFSTSPMPRLWLQKSTMKKIQQEWEDQKKKEEEEWRLKEEEEEEWKWKEEKDKKKGEAEKEAYEKALLNSQKM